MGSSETLYPPGVHVMYLLDLTALSPIIDLRILSTKYKLNLALRSEGVGMGLARNQEQTCMSPARRVPIVPHGPARSRILFS